MEILDNKQGRTVEHEIAKRLDSNTSISINTEIFNIYTFYLLQKKIKRLCFKTIKKPPKWRFKIHHKEKHSCLF